MLPDAGSIAGSRDCQKAHWRSGHRADCRASRKSQREIDDLEHWLHQQGVTSGQAFLDVFAYSTTVEGLIAAPKEDIEGLTEAWESPMRQRFLEAIDAKRAALKAEGETLLLFY